MRAATGVLLAVVGFVGLACSSESAAHSGATSTGCKETPGSAIGGPDFVPSDAPWQVKLGPGKDLAATPDNVTAAARGQRLIFAGRVLDRACNPVAGAAVDIWQVNGDRV